MKIFYLIIFMTLANLSGAWATTFTGLSASNATGHQITLNWTTDVPTETRVRYRRQGNSAWIYYFVSPDATTNHSVTLRSLEASTQYEWYVFQGDVLHMSAQSAIDTFSTLSDPNRHWQSNDMTFLGAMVMPQGDFGSPQYHGFHYGGTAISYNHVSDTLYVVGHDWDQMVAEVNIDLSNSISTPKTTTVVQNFSNLTDGHYGDLNLNSNGTPVKWIMGGMQLLDNGKLLGGFYEYYDGNSDHHTSLFFSPTDFSGATQGPYDGGTFPGTSTLLPSGFTGDYMCRISDKWKPQLGADVAVGGAGMSIVGRTSMGPSLIAYNSSKIGTPDIAPKILLSYPTIPSIHYLYSIDRTNPFFNWQGHDVSGAFWIDGNSQFTDTVVFVGQKGIGDICYGAPTNDIGKTDIDPATGLPYKDPISGFPYCYDPAKYGGEKGGHSFPYIPYYWAYNPSDLKKAIDGLIKPWEIEPVSMGDLSHILPTTEIYLPIAATFDQQRGRMFFSLKRSSTGDVPTILAYSINTTAPAPTAPTIVSHPVNQTVPAGKTAQFSVGVTGTGPFTFSWWKNGTEQILGANKGSLVLSSTKLDNSGSYSCRISNAAGSVTSNSATLTVSESSNQNNPSSPEISYESQPFINAVKKGESFLIPCDDTIKIYDQVGHLVKELGCAGHMAEWNTKSAASGAYTVRGKSRRESIVVR